MLMTNLLRNIQCKWQLILICCLSSVWMWLAIHFILLDYATFDMVDGCVKIVSNTHLLCMFPLFIDGTQYAVDSGVCPGHCGSSTIPRRSVPVQYDTRWLRVEARLRSRSLSRSRHHDDIVHIEQSQIEGKILITENTCMGHGCGIGNSCCRAWRVDDGKDLDDEPEILKFNLRITNLQLDTTQKDWLRNSNWDSGKDTMILVHGYAGGEDGLPMSVLRDGK